MYRIMLIFLFLNEKKHKRWYMKVRDRLSEKIVKIYEIMFKNRLIASVWKLAASIDVMPSAKSSPMRDGRVALTSAGGGKP